MEFKLCEYLLYTGKKPIFNQSVERQKYNFNIRTGHICHVPNPEHMKLLVKRIPQLLPIVLIEIAGKASVEAPKSEPDKPVEPKELKPTKPRRKHAKRG